MKKLTMGQLREVGVYNPWVFCYDFWYLGFTTHSRQTMGSSGWRVEVPKRPSKEVFHQGYALHAFMNGNTKPERLRNLPETLAGLGFAYPSRWVKFMGVWMDADFQEKRMAELVERWKARKEDQP